MLETPVSSRMDGDCNLAIHLYLSFVGVGKIFGQEFYNGLTRKYVIVFGTLFNEIIISRSDNNDVQQQRLRVPISYGPAQKFLRRLAQDNSLNRAEAISLPRLSFQLEQVTYAPDRRLQTLGRGLGSSTRGSLNDETIHYFNPAPYDLEFTLTIYAKFQEDGMKILEQIVPYFKPEWTSTVQLLDDQPNELFDIPVILNSVSNEEIYEGDFEERRVVMWTLSFTMKGYYFGPSSTRKVIKFANVSTYAQMTANGTLSANLNGQRTRVYPGLTSANTPADFLSEQTYNATATANLTGNSVNMITVSNNGLGYSNATVTLSDPDTGSNTATATAIVENDRIYTISVVNSGSEYDSPPTVTISAPDNVSITHANINFDDPWDYIVITEDIPIE